MVRAVEKVLVDFFDDLSHIFPFYAASGDAGSAEDHEEAEKDAGIARNLAMKNRDRETLEKLIRPYLLPASTLTSRRTPKTSDLERDFAHLVSR